MSNIFHFKSGKKKSVSKLKQSILIELCKLFDLPTDDSNCLKLRDMHNNVTIDKIMETIKNLPNFKCNNSKSSDPLNNDDNCNNNVDKNSIRV